MSVTEQADNSFHKVELTLKQPRDQISTTVELVNIFSVLDINDEEDLVHSKNKEIFGFVMIGNTELVAKLVLMFKNRDGMSY
jgi:hypothetical protein